MKQHPGHRRSLKNLLRNLRRDERGAVLIMVTVYLPVIVGFFTLAVDYSYTLRTRNTLQVTAEAAALAAASYLPDPTATTTCPAAKNYASLNMPVANYGNVLKQNTGDCSDVVVGMWAAPNFTSNATTPCGIQCNAVKVTTRMSAANSNSLQLAFASMIGWSTIDVTATAIAVYGNDPNALPWNVSIVQDVSGSFLQEIGNAKAADQALETCMLNNSSSGSKLGISLFGKTSLDYQTPLVVSSNNGALTTKITNINVGGQGMPSDAATNIGAGINTAISQICPGTTCTPAPTTFKPALVIVTDGMANSCGNSACPAGQTPQSQAEAAATAAGNMGMDVYAIYFCSDNDCGNPTNTTAANWLSGLVKGNGKFAKTPTASDMASLMVTGVCKPSHVVRLVW